jgi:hypothetical protein
VDPLTILILVSSLAVPFLVGWERIESHRLKQLREGQEIRRDQLHRRTTRLLIGASALTIILVIFNFAQTVSDKRSADKRATGLSNQLAQLSDENRGLRDEVCNTRKALSDLLAVDSVKPTLDLSVRAEMLRVKREVDAGTKCTGNWGAIVATWSNKMAQAAQDRERFHQATLTKQIKAIEPSLPVWDSTIKIFQSRLTEYLKPLNRKVIADCDGL